MIDYIWHIVIKVVNWRKGRVLLFGWLCCVPIISNMEASNAGFEVYPYQHLEAMQSILDVSPTAASKIAVLKRHFPKHPATVYLENYKALAEFMAYGKPLDAQMFPVLAEQRMAQIALLVSDPIAAVYQCNMLLQVALVHAMEGNQLKAFRAVVKAYQLQKQIPATDSFLQERLKLALIFDLFWSMVPDDYHWAIELWGGYVEGGNTLVRLKTYVKGQQGVMGLGDEAHLLTSIYYLKSGVDNIHVQRPLVSKPILLYVDGLLAMKNKQQHLVLPLINDEICALFPPLHYIKGRMMLNSLQDGADDALKSYIDHYNGSAFKLDAMLRLAWCALLDDDGLRAMAMSNNILNAKMGSTYADRQAYAEAAHISSTPKEMLKVRLLFDAGLYSQSLDVALTHLHLGTKFPCEYHYRKARARHELGLFEMALADYGLAIGNNTEPSRYFAPNAALKSAQIFFHLGQIEKAKTMLQLCLSINRKEYAESIKTEARQLMKLINAKEYQ